MNKKMNTGIYLAVLTLLVGCSRGSELQLILAKQEIDVYSEYEQNKRLFKIMPGEVCAVGNEVEKKVFTYRRVLCADGRSGYIIAKADNSYQLIKD